MRMAEGGGHPGPLPDSVGSREYVLLGDSIELSLAKADSCELRCWISSFCSQARFPWRRGLGREELDLVPHNNRKKFHH